MWSRWKDKKKSETKDNLCCNVSSLSEEGSCSTKAHSDGNECCSPQPKGNLPCPYCLQEAKAVLSKTLEHLLTQGVKSRLACLDGFYFCKTPSCKVVYFRNKEVLRQEDISVVVGHKDGVKPATVCYCFEWTKEKIEAELEKTGETTALDDIKAKMESPGCSCEVLNPSGGCCLSDVSKAIKEIKKDLGIRKKES